MVTKIRRTKALVFFQRVGWGRGGGGEGVQGLVRVVGIGHVGSASGKARHEDRAAT